LNAGPRRTMRLSDQHGRDYPVELAGLSNTAPQRQAVLNEGGERFVLRPWRAVGGADGGVGSGSILAPMPGKVIAVEVVAGDTVTKGQKLLTLEAMKMEHTLTAPFDGVVEEVNCTAGDQVQVEALLVKIDTE
ncbi:acetyl-CoA carboxylase biotin carboxyl carrier protein subunit, partial [Brevundimonas sp. UBA5866]